MRREKSTMQSINLFQLLQQIHIVTVECMINTVLISDHSTFRISLWTPVGFRYFVFVVCLPHHNNLIPNLYRWFLRYNLLCFYDRTSITRLFVYSFSFILLPLQRKYEIIHGTNDWITCRLHQVSTLFEICFFVVVWLCCLVCRCDRWLFLLVIRVDYNQKND